MQAARPGNDDRLPWLEPYRDTMAQKRRAARRSHGGLVALAGALILLVVAAGAGYWLGQRSDDAPPRQPSATVALPPPKPAPIEVATVTAPAAPEAAEPAPVEPAAAEPPKPVKKAAKRKPAPRKKKIRSAGIQKTRLDAVRTAQERQARSRYWPKMPSPGPAGQVIQLGAFSTPVRAHSAYSTRIARYPGLAAMPKVVVPVVTKPDGRILYVLRLGTTSRQQSKTVCRNLRASGDHCLVIG